MSNTEGVPEDERAVVKDRPENYDQQVKDAQTAAQNEERDEHNRRMRESAGQDEAISDATGERLSDPQAADVPSTPETSDDENPVR